MSFLDVNHSTSRRRIFEETQENNDSQDADMMDVCSTPSKKRRLFHDSVPHRTPISKFQSPARRSMASTPQSFEFNFTPSIAISSQFLKPLSTISNTIHVDSVSNPKTTHEKNTEWFRVRELNFNIISRKLNMDENTKTRGRDVFLRTCSKNIDRCQSIMFAEKSWIACALWMASKLSYLEQLEQNATNPAGSGIRLTQLLQVSELPITNFIRELREFLQVSDLEGLSVKQREFLIHAIETVVNSYGVISTVHGKFTEIFKSLVRYDRNTQLKTGFGENEKFLDELLMFTWILFLNAKEIFDQKKLCQNDAIIASIASINFVLAQVPAQYRRQFSYVFHSLHTTHIDHAHDTNANSNPNFTTTPELEAGNWLCYQEEVKKRLCEINSLHYDHLSQFENEVFSPMITQFVRDSVLRCSGQIEPFGHTTLYQSFPGMIDSQLRGLFPQNLKSLNNHYEIRLCSQLADYDGRTLISISKVLETPRKRATPKQMIGKSPRARSLLPALNKASVYNQSMSSTPLSAKDLSVRKDKCTDLTQLQHTLVTQLDLLVLDLPPSLVEMLKHLAANEVQNIKDRTNQILVSLKSKDPSSHDYWKMGVKLYYRLFESIVIWECRRSGQNCLSRLVNNDTFHRCMIACAIELIRHSFSIDSTTFEEILFIINVRQFDFCLITEFVIKLESSLSWILVRRLKEIEERILESQAWQEIDPLYHLMSETASNQASVNVENPRVSYHEIIVPFVPSEATSEYVTGGIRPKPRTGALEMFLQKLYRLIRIRLASLIKTLKLSEELHRKAWDVIVTLIEKEPETLLLHKRHVDVIIMCSVYGLCKILNVDITFKGIIDGYRSQPQCMHETYRKIRVDEKEEPVDIIQFYNRVFLPKSKVIIYNHRNGSTSNSTGAVANQSNESINVFASPVRSRPATNDMTLMTPITTRLFSVGESPSLGITPSASVRAQPKKTNSNHPLRRRLDFSAASSPVSAIKQRLPQPSSLRNGFIPGQSQ